LLHHIVWYLLIVPFTTTFRTACNALDGLVSRELGLASSFGEVLNEFIDRISDVIIFLSVIRLAATDTTLGFLTLIMVLLNSYMGILSKSAGGPRQYGGLMGKPDRMILISVAALLIVVTHHTQIWNYFLWLVLIGTFITLIQRFLLTKHQLEHMNVNTKS
jgi:archaetidylinositol phosphate synthase